MTILSSARWTIFYRAIAEGREAELTRIHGLGKKNSAAVADRPEGQSRKPPARVAGLVGAEKEKQRRLVDEALSAMLRWGYSQAEAQRAVDAALAEFAAEPDVARLIQVALRKIGDMHLFTGSQVDTNERLTVPETAER
jgi:Holliday junction resolvasome RuvABC DNA-binding subunit